MIAIQQPTLGPLSTFVGGALRTGGYYPNEYDACLDNDYRIWCNILARGGLESVCRPVGSRPYSARPWVEQPDGGRTFSPVEVLDVNSFVEGVETTVLTVEVPFGYDGVINYVVATVLPSAGAPSNFSDGSGQITWRLTANGLATSSITAASRHLRDWGNVIVSRGSMTDPSPIPNGGLRIYSRNLIQMTVELSAGSGLNPQANILCSVQGWVYPRP